VPNRHGSSTAYRYGFQGQEKDDELKGEGNSYDFGARLYDSRVGRWFAPDKMEGKYPSYSTYSAFGNMPLFFVDKDGNENIVYIVNVPDSNGRKSISDKELKRRIDKANTILQSNAEKGGYELKTKYVLFNPDVQVPHRGPFSRAGMDKNDGVILMGKVEDIKRYDRQNKITDFANDDTSLPGNKGWTGNDGAYPETTVYGNKRGGYVETETTTEDAQVYLILHSSGHQHKTNVNKGEDHTGNSNSPSIMMSGTEKSFYLQKKGNKTSQIWNSILIGNTPNGKLDNNGFRGRMLKNFGNKESVDNYDKNKADNDKKIGPKQKDGTF
jgi:RHS repeat-associated protein